MMPPPLPADWNYEGPDESVGIPGRAFWHDCPGDELATEKDVGLVFIPRHWGMELAVITQLTCGDCGETILISDTDVLYTYDESEAPYDHAQADDADSLVHREAERVRRLAAHSHGEPRHG